MTSTSTATATATSTDTSTTAAAISTWIRVRPTDGPEELCREVALPAEQVAEVESAPAGCYQRDLVRGRETWSGSSLRGRAASYAGRYARSRSGLIDRINARLSAPWWAESALVLEGKRWRRRLVLRSAAEDVVHVW